MFDKINFQKKQSFILILFYFVTFFSVVFVFKDLGVHIEEKFHRMNGLYWLNYIAQIFNFEKISLITEIKMKEVSDYTLSSVQYYNKYGVIFDVPLALIEIIFNIEKIENIYHTKHFSSFIIFLISSFFFFKILTKRFKNFFLCFAGTVLFITFPRIFGDSFFYKDVLFLSFFNIALYFFLELLEKLDLKNLLYFALFSAIAFNLRIFGIFLPVALLLLLIIKSFYNKNFFEYAKFYLFYLLSFFFLLILISPYLWESPIINFVKIFTQLKESGIIKIRILFDNELISNRNVPADYLITWMLISTPVFIIIFFISGYVSFFLRLINRFFTIKEKNIFNDLWRGNNEQKDFTIFFLLTSYFFIFTILNAPLHNGWRLVYFLNIFIIYFSIYFLNNLFLSFRNKKFKRYLLFSTAVVSIVYNIFSLIVYHPYQSYYFNELVSDNKKNNFEIDYYGLSAKDFFLKISEENEDKLLKIGVASNTPLHRGLEGINMNLRKNLTVVGQEYHNADFIYKNNITDVNRKLNKKYNMPNNFDKIHELKIDGMIIYEIYKNKNIK